MSDVDARREGMRAWLETTGFPLEFAVFDAMRAAGFRAEMGARYEAIDGSKLRETDVVGEEPEATADLQVVVVAECKHAGRPWVVRCQPSPEPEDLIGDLLMHPNLARPLRDYVVNNDDLPFFLWRRRDLGFGVVEGPEQDKQRNLRDQPYGALQAVLSAARSLVADKSPYDNGWLAWPFIVIAGELWTVSPGDGKPQLDEVPWQRVRWRAAPREPATLIDIVTKPALEEYLHDLRGDTHWLANWMKRLPRIPSSIVA